MTKIGKYVTKIVIYFRSGEKIVFAYKYSWEAELLRESLCRVRIAIITVLYELKQSIFSLYVICAVGFCFAKISETG